MANLENLKLSIDLMKKVRKNKRAFGLAGWEYKAPADDPKHPCKTVHCVGGFMMLDPAHNARGFGWSRYSGGALAPFYDDNHDFSALSEFWGVNYLEAKAIAAESYYDGPPSISTVIGRMEMLHRTESLSMAMETV